MNQIAGREKYAVEYRIQGYRFVYEARDEDDARRICAQLDGRILVRTDGVWTDAS